LTIGSPSANENLLPITPLVIEILGVDSARFDNAIPHTPSNDPSHLYNPSLYDETSKSEGGERTY
jgi:hypothetical protein